jgi:hypothetical protein
VVPDAVFDITMSVPYIPGPPWFQGEQTFASEHASIWLGFRTG